MEGASGTDQELIGPVFNVVFRATGTLAVEQNFMPVHMKVIGNMFPQIIETARNIENAPTLFAVEVVVVIQAGQLVTSRFTGKFHRS